MILRVRVPEEMALIFPTVDSGWSHEASPLTPPALPSPPSPPSAALRTRIDKDTTRPGCITPSISRNCYRRSREILVPRISELFFVPAPLSHPPILPGPRRLYVVGIPLEKCLCNIACNLSANSSLLLVSVARLILLGVSSAYARL